MNFNNKSRRIQWKTFRRGLKILGIKAVFDVFSVATEIHQSVRFSFVRYSEINISLHTLLKNGS